MVKNKMSPLRSFLTQEILPGLSCPLFSGLNDIMSLGIKTPGNAWYGKEIKNLKPLVSLQMKCRDEKLIKNISGHYGLYKLLILQRLGEITTVDSTKERVLVLFDVAFKKHELAESFLDQIKTIPEIIIDEKVLGQVLICLKANGGKSSLNQIVFWIQNMQKSK